MEYIPRRSVVLVLLAFSPSPHRPKHSPRNVRLVLRRRLLLLTNILDG